MELLRLNKTKKGISSLELTPFSLFNKPWFSKKRQTIVKNYL